MDGIITGDSENRTVKINGITLSPERSLKIRNHSPDGFSWGYSGSGPAQLALAILLEFGGTISHYQKFKEEVIARLPQSDFELPVKIVKDWIDNDKKKV